MDTNKGREARSHDDIDNIQPQWPQRPGRPQPSAHKPHLEPPAERPARGSSAPRRDTPSRYTEPMAYPSRPIGSPEPARSNDPKETRVLPVVEPSRFDRNGQARIAPAPTPGTQAPARPAPSQTAAKPRPREIQTASSARSSAPMPPAAQPQVRKPGGWQYEREEDYDDYQEPQAYAPARATSHGQNGKSLPRNLPDHSRSYLSVSIEGGRKRRFGWVLWLFGAVLAIALIGGMAVALAWQGQYAGKIYQGVTVMNTDLSSKTPEEAKKILRDKVESFVAQPVVLSWRGKEWRPSAEQLGVKVDVDTTVDEAFRVGRSADLFSNVGQQWMSVESGYNVPLTVQISEPALQTYLQGIASSEIDQKLFEGDIRLDGDKIDARPGAEGRTLRVYDAVSAIRDQVAKLEPGKVDLPVDTVQPSVSAEEVQYIQGLLQVRISGPITATAPSKIEVLNRDAIIRFTTIQRNPDRSASRHLELGWNDAQLKILADRWAQESNRPAQNARFAWNNGAVSVLSESTDGFETDSNTIMGGIKEAAGTSDSRQFAMPGKVITPTVSSKDIGALGIKEQIGQGLSTFKGSSPERATNIKVAANLLNGAVVPPGGTFSFLQTMGGIDESHGFVPGYVIAAERTQLGVGGGVCQVSTTTFRAAFWAGLKITERNQHSYRVSWYEANGEPVGFDAAVFDPGVDLKFVNDSPGYILIQATVSPDTLTVTVYGTKTPGEQVKLEGPVISNRQPAPPDVYQVDQSMPAGSKKQVETAHAGLNTLITRRIIIPGQPDKVDQFSSAYKPWPNWFIVSSASQVPGGTQAAPNPTPNP